MDAFLKVHEDEIAGALTMFDRVIFRGYLSTCSPRAPLRAFGAPGGAAQGFRAVCRADHGGVEAHVQQLAEAAGRPYEYLESATTKASGVSKEDRARAMAERDAIHAV